MSQSTLRASTEAFKKRLNAVSDDDKVDILQGLQTGNLSGQPEWVKGFKQDLEDNGMKPAGALLSIQRHVQKALAIGPERTKIQTQGGAQVPGHDGADRPNQTPTLGGNDSSA